MQRLGPWVVLGVAFWVGAVWAQRKPDAPPVATSGNRPPDMALFKKAYEKAGEPRLLIVCGMDSRRAELALAGVRYNIRQTHVTATDQTTVVTQGQPKADDAVDEAQALIKRPQTATGDVQSSGHIGQHVSLFDPTGVSAKLQSDIESHLLAHRGLALVHPSAMAEADRREVQLLAQRDQHEAIALLGSKVNADLVLSVRMLPIPSRASVQGARYRVLVDLVKPTRGRKIGGFAFDWRLGTDSEAVGAYGEQITRKFIEQLAHWYDREDVPAQKYNVRVVGAKDVGQVVAAKRAFGKIKGLGKIRDRGFSGDGKTSVALLEMRYPGAALDLIYELQQAAMGVLPMTIEAADASTGTITLILNPSKTISKTTDATATASSNHQGDLVGRTVREQILVAYGKAQSPGMAVLALADDPLADHVHQQLKGMGFSVVGPKDVQKKAAAALAIEGPERLSQVAKATGTALVVHLSSSAELNRHVLRLVRVEDGLTLGIESFGGGAQTKVWANHALAKILHQAAELWSPPNQLHLEVAGADSQRQVLAMMTLLQQQVPGVEAAQFDRFEENGQGGAVGHVRLIHRGEAEGLIKEIESRGPKLSYRSVGSNRDLSAMKIQVQ